MRENTSMTEKTTKEEFQKEYFLSQTTKEKSFNQMLINLPVS
jgi:hypothetical protein